MGCSFKIDGLFINISQVVIGELILQCVKTDPIPLCWGVFALFPRQGSSGVSAVGF